MYLTLIGVLLLLLKWLEFGPVAAWSWWWVLSPFAAAFLWFEFGERAFGRDKQRIDHVEYESRRKERVAQQFASPPARKARSRS